MILSSDRARVLMEQNRFSDAEKELQKVLASDPNDPETLSLMAWCKASLKEFKAAEELIKQAITRDPANAFYLFIYSHILFHQNKLTEAEDTINQAIKTDPYNADYFGLLSAIFLDRKEWNKALEAANEGLQIEAENLQCLNSRASALIKVDKKDESFETIKDAFNYNPENAYTHINYGWGLLEKGEHKKSLEHFSKALQIDPTSPHAKHGLVEALKARYWIYRIFLRYAFWIGNMKGKVQWAIIIGFYVGSRVMRSVAASNPELQVFLTPLIFLYALFAISTWVLNPLSNLFLRLNVYGRYALTKNETTSSTFVGLSLLTGIVGFLGYLILKADLLFMIGILGLTMMIPLGSMLIPEKKSSRLTLVLYTLGLLAVAATGIGFYLTENPGYDMMGTTYLIGIFIFQWVANAVIIRK